MTSGLAAACSLVLLPGAGHALARPPEAAPATSPPTIVCRSGRADPARCRRFDVRVSNGSHRTACVEADGRARARFSLFYSDRARRADARGAEKHTRRRCR